MKKSHKMPSTKKLCNNDNNNKYIYKAQKTKGFYALYMAKHNVQYKIHTFI